jgi:hypothetical protein
MRRAAILAAASIALAACAGQSENEAAGAPAPDDTTGVTQAIDSARTGPPGVAGRPGDATVTSDSVVSDTAMVGADTTGATGDSPVSTPQDTLGPSTPDTAVGADTSSWR